MYSFSTMAITLFLAMDALGVIPIYLAFVKRLPTRQKLWIAGREMVIALFIMILFFFLGPYILALLNLNPKTTQIAGGIVIFLIAIRLIFPPDEEITVTKWEKGKEPFVVPIATPLIAGPSVLAIIMIYAQESGGSYSVLGAIFVAWILSCVLFFFAGPLYRLITEKGLIAAQRLMGLVIALIAIQMVVQGVKGLLK